MFGSSERPRVEGTCAYGRYWLGQVLEDMGLEDMVFEDMVSETSQLHHGQVDGTRESPVTGKTCR